MNPIRKLHEDAMDLAEIAFITKLKGDDNQAIEMFQRAYEKEAQVAKQIAENSTPEPTRSIMYRSAASLAFNCGKLKEAERLIAAGLAGEPPKEIAEELRELFEKVNFERHLRLRGVNLSTEEFQMSLAGNAVSSGIMLIEEFTRRTDDIRKIVGRTTERLMKKPYREGGSASKGIREYPLFISMPRAASFAVSLRIGYPKQPELPFLSLDSTHIIDEVLTCLELFNNSEKDELEKKIPQKAYYRNFVGIAKNLAPDGDLVSLVGFTVIRDGKEKIVELTKPKGQINLAIENQTDKEVEIKEITGRLLFADATKKRKQAIRLIDKDDNLYRITVPEGMMSDIVKPLWEDIVTVTGFYQKKEKAIRLVDIRRTSQDE
jgi:hypothetical protein